MINNSIWEGNQVAVKVNSFLLAQYSAMRHSGVTRISKLHGHSMGTLSACVTRICYRTWGIYTPAIKKFGIMHFEIAHSSDLPVCLRHVHTKLRPRENWTHPT